MGKAAAKTGREEGREHRNIVVVVSPLHTPHTASLLSPSFDSQGMAFGLLVLVAAFICCWCVLLKKKIESFHTIVVGNRSKSFGRIIQSENGKVGYNLLLSFLSPVLASCQVLFSFSSPPSPYARFPKEKEREKPLSPPPPPPPPPTVAVFVPSSLFLGGA